MQAEWNFQRTHFKVSCQNMYFLQQFPLHFHAAPVAPGYFDFCYSVQNDRLYVIG